MAQSNSHARPDDNSAGPKTKLLNLQKTAAYCDCSIASIRRWCEQGTFPPPRKRQHGYVRWHIDDLDAWVSGKTDWPSCRNPDARPERKSSRKSP
jgi:predicted DNA-binding transcriptional regulator AlpA